jgi:hypothetical protein
LDPPNPRPSFCASDGISAAKDIVMQASADLFDQAGSSPAPLSFWERIVNDDQLDGCKPLEKLLAGCEIIAALDRVDLLLAA